MNINLLFNAENFVFGLSESNLRGSRSSVTVTHNVNKNYRSAIIYCIKYM
jgi:hypothetical protein